jgi:hypothetical protein
MPFSSKSQERKFFSLESEGNLPKGTAKQWASETDQKSLPERVHSKKVILRKKRQGMFNK